MVSVRFLVLGTLIIQTSAHFGSFGLFPPLNPFSNLGPIYTRISALETSLASFRTQISSLTSGYQILLAQLGITQSQVISLQSQIGTITLPKCPATAPSGSVIVGSYCYSVGTTASTFDVALAACRTAGGSLAEPQPTLAASNNFYSALKTAFPSQFTIIEAANGGQLWIGYDTVTGTFHYQSVTTNAQVVPVAGSITVLGTAISQGALLNKPGGTGSYWNPALKTAVNPYVCQYAPLN